MARVISNETVHLPRSNLSDFSLSPFLLFLDPLFLARYFCAILCISLRFWVNREWRGLIKQKPYASVFFFRFNPSSRGGEGLREIPLSTAEVPRNCKVFRLPVFTDPCPATRYLKIPIPCYSCTDSRRKIYQRFLCLLYNSIYSLFTRYDTLL